MKDGTATTGQAAYDEAMAQLRTSAPEPAPDAVARRPAPASLPGSLYGHARMTDSRRAQMGGHADLTLYGTAEAPSLYAATPDSFSGVRLDPRRDDLVRFCREVLAFLGEDYGVTLPPWRPASNGAGKRHWFLYRDGTDQSVPLADRYHYSAAGTLVRYASADAAQRAADRLNTPEATA